MRIAFLTVGDPARLTGGYLYHALVFARLRAQGVTIDEVVAGPADLAAQLALAERFGASFDPRPYAVIVVDALARAVCAPWLDSWRAQHPLVAMVHELPSIAADDAALRDLEAALLRADRLIAVSRHGQAILEARGVPALRIAVVSPGYDRLVQCSRTMPAGFHHGATEPRGRQLVEDVGLGQRIPLRALCVAQWIPRKAIHTLVEAWVAQPRPGAVLELIGETEADPSYAALMRARIAALPAATIVARGPVGDAELAAAYRGADLFVLPSRYEGYGMAYAEALAYGLPVIACSIGPLPELLGDAALLIPPDDPQALVEALDSMLGDERLRSRLGAAALQRAAQLPSWDAAAAGFLAALEQAQATRRLQ